MTQPRSDSTPGTAAPTVSPDDLAGLLGDGLLADGWSHLPVPAVDRTVLIGPGGVVVLFARRPAGTTTPRPDEPRRGWNGEERRRPASAQVTAEHVAHLVSERTGLLIGCKPVVVLADDDTRLVARLDDVAVLHRRRLAEWLARQPRHLDPATIQRIRAAFGATV